MACNISPASAVGVLNSFGEILHFLFSMLAVDFFKLLPARDMEYLA